MISVSSNFGPELTALNNALSRAGAVGRRSKDEIVQRATADLILGSRGTGAGAGAFPGLFDSFRQIAPNEGKATAEAEARGWRMKSNSTSMNRARDEAERELGTAKSGVFKVIKSGKRISSIKRVYMRTRGKAKGSVYIRGRGRMAKTVVPLANRSGRRSGYSVLNKQALATAIATKHRESARGATAAQFLKKRYRRVLVRRRSQTYTRGGMTRGIDAMTQAVTHRHDRVAVKNKAGRTIGSLEIKTGGRFVSFSRIRGEIGTTPRFNHIVRNAITSVTIDREAYLLNRQIRQALRRR